MNKPTDKVEISTEPSAVNEVEKPMTSVQRMRRMEVIDKKIGELQAEREKHAKILRSFLGGGE